MPRLSTTSFDVSAARARPYAFVESRGTGKPEPFPTREQDAQDVEREDQHQCDRTTPEADVVDGPRRPCPDDHSGYTRNDCADLAHANDHDTKTDDPGPGERPQEESEDSKTQRWPTTDWRVLHAGPFVDRMNRVGLSDTGFAWHGRHPNPCG